MNGFLFAVFSFASLAVENFEEVAYGTRALWEERDERFPAADYWDRTFQITNYSSDSLAVSMRNRCYGYELMEGLEEEALVERMEAALACMVEYEKLVGQTNQCVYGDRYFVQGQELLAGFPLVAQNGTD